MAKKQMNLQEAMQMVKEHATEAFNKLPALRLKFPNEKLVTDAEVKARQEFINTMSEAVGILSRGNPEGDLDYALTTMCGLFGALLATSHEDRFCMGCFTQTIELLTKHIARHYSLFTGDHVEVAGVYTADDPHAPPQEDEEPAEPVTHSKWGLN